MYINYIILILLLIKMLNSVLRAVHLQKTTRNSAGLSINATSPKCYINVSNIYVQNMKVCNRVV